MDTRLDFTTNWPGLTRVLKKMCTYVGADFDKIDFWNDDDEYFRKYRWKEGDEEDFIKWLGNELYADKGLRKEMMERPVKNKKICTKCAEEFNWNNGWMRYSQESNDSQRETFSPLAI